MHLYCILSLEVNYAEIYWLSLKLGVEVINGMQYRWHFDSLRTSFWSTMLTICNHWMNTHYEKSSYAHFYLHRSYITEPKSQIGQKRVKYNYNTTSMAKYLTQLYIVNYTVQDAIQTAITQCNKETTANPLVFNCFLTLFHDLLNVLNR